MATVDSLDVQITAQATAAVKSLDTLNSKLTTLSSSLSQINSSGLTGLANSVNSLTTAMQGMKSVGTADFTRLAKNVEKLGAIDNKKLSSLSRSLTQLSNGFSQIGMVASSGTTQQLQQLTKSISQLGYKSATQAIENIPKLATAMNQLMTELSKAPVVSRNLINMTNALARLTKASALSGSTAKSTSSFIDLLSTSSGRATNWISKLASKLNIFSATAGKATKSSFSLAAAIGKIYATYWLLFRVFSKLGDAVGYASDLTEVQNIVDNVFGDAKSQLEDFANNSIQYFGMSILTAKSVASEFQAMGNAMGITNKQVADSNATWSEAQTELTGTAMAYDNAADSVADMSLNLTKLAADLGSFYNKDYEDVAENLASGIYSGQSRVMRQYGIDLTQATLKEFALANGLNSDISSMTNAEKTMLRYQYVMSRTENVQSDFLRTSSSWANTTRVLSQNLQNLGSVIGSITINAFKPFIIALNTAILKFTEFAKVVLNALGKIFGWQYDVGSGATTLGDDYEDAADSAGTLADNTGTAAKNVDKMKKGLREFDELKTISLETSSGTGSGSSGTGSGGTSGGTSASGGTWTQTDSILKSFESDINTLEELGETIRDALIKAMGNIDWDSIYKKAEGFGSGLASFLNGLFSEDKDGNTVFGSVGTTIAGALNTAVHVIDSFGTTFDWKPFGKSLKKGVKKALKGFDFTTLQNAAKKWGTGIADTLNAFFSGDKGETVLGTVGTTIAEVLNTKLHLLDSFGTGFDWKQFGQSIADGINNFFKKFDFKLLTDTINTWSDGIYDTIVTVISETDWVEAFKEIVTALSSLSIESWTILLGIPLLSYAGELATKGIKKWLLEKLVVAGGEGFALTAAGTGLAWSLAIAASITISIIAAEVVEDYRQKLYDSIFGTNEDGTSKSYTYTGQTTGADYTYGSTSQVLSTTASTGVGIGIDQWLTDLGGLKDSFAEAEEASRQSFASMSKYSSEGLTSVGTDIVGVTGKLGDYNTGTNNASQYTTTGWSQIKTDIGDAMTSISGSVEDKWQAVVDWWKEKNVLETISSAVEDFKKNVKEKWDAVVAYWKDKDILGDISAAVESFRKNVKEKWEAVLAYWKDKDILGKISAAVEEFKDNVKKKWQSVISYWKDKTSLGKISAAIDDFKENIKKKWESVKTYWKTNHTLSEITATIFDIKKKLTDAWAAAKKWWSDNVKLSIPTLNFKVTYKTTGLNILQRAVVKALNLSGWPSLSFYKTGGFPDKSSLFVAGENGIPEMLGTIGGRTAVAGGAEITGIADAVYSTGHTEADLLNTAVSLLRIIADKEYGISENDIGKSARNYAKDYFNRTGREAYSF
jgi:hypothetical protein